MKSFMDGMTDKYRLLKEGELLPEEADEVADTIMDEMMDGIRCYTEKIMDTLLDQPVEDAMMVLVALNLSEEFYGALVPEDTHEVAEEVIQNMAVNRVDINLLELYKQMEQLRREEHGEERGDGHRDEPGDEQGGR